ncbi:MAG: hypothetical protein NT007_07650 [Candidatus Kapabacteria bacterium]|nr:hypothetical protein [Candidatus Kapabacteria bacterium]
MNYLKNKFASLILDKQNLPDTSLITPFDLDYNTKYFWRVHTKGAENQGDWSVVRNFTSTIKSVI